MNIIKKENIKTILEKLKNIKKVIVLGKGPTFRTIDEKDILDNTFIICVNDTINFTNFFDLLVVNDVITWDRIDNNKIKSLKYILTPIFPHKKGKPENKEYNMNWTIKKLKEKGFNGNLIFYNLLTSKINNSFIILDSKISGSNNAIDFVTNFLNINILETRGIGIINKDKYNNNFEKTEGYSLYNQNYLKRINNHIIKKIEEKKINYIKI